jgi:hypothetical protein
MYVPMSPIRLPGFRCLSEDIAVLIGIELVEGEVSPNMASCPHFIGAISEKSVKVK